MPSFVRYENINVNLLPSTVASSPSKNVLLIGQRTTGGAILPSKNGFPQPNYYVPFKLPAFPNGNAALAYLANFGIQYQIGYNFSLVLPAPTAVSTTSGVTTLSWTTVPYGFDQLIEFALSGTATQIVSSIAVTVPIRSANITSGTANLLLTGGASYTTSATIAIAGVNNVPFPDPNNSDPIALMVWDFYQSAVSAFTSANGAPSCYISILCGNGRDTTITPTTTPIALTHPTTVTVNSDDSVTLAFAYTGGISTLTEFGYLPTTAYGTTNITQATSAATGVYGGYSIAPSSSTAGTVSIHVTDVMGTFDTTHNLSVVLDNTLNVFDFVDNVDLAGAVLQFPIGSSGNITTQSAFFNGVTTLNQPNQVLNNHYFTFAFAGNITSLPNAAASLPSPNTQNYVLVTYPYVQKFGDIPYDNTAGTVGSGRVASAVAYMIANGDAPYPPLTTATINHLPVSSVSSTTSYSVTPGGTADIAIQQGWLPLAPNTNNVVNFVQSNTTMITIPDTTVTDTEFRYTHPWGCVRRIKFNVSQLYNTISVLPNNEGAALITPNFLEEFRVGIIATLLVLEGLGVVQNVSLYSSLVVVIQDPINPTQVDATVPSQIIPQLNGAEININVFSSLTTTFS